MPTQSNRAASACELARSSWNGDCTRVLGKPPELTRHSHTSNTHPVQLLRRRRFAALGPRRPPNVSLFNPSEANAPMGNTRLNHKETRTMQSRFSKVMSVLAAAAISVLPAAPTFADEGHGPKGKPGAVTPVAANPKSVGVPAPNVLSPELIEAIVAQGSWTLENPS